MSVKLKQLLKNSDFYNGSTYDLLSTTWLQTIAVAVSIC